MTSSQHLYEVRPRKDRRAESMAETQPKLQPRFLRLSAMVFQYRFNVPPLCRFRTPHSNDEMI
jgi:hypothetical protein